MSNGSVSRDSLKYLYHIVIYILKNMPTSVFLDPMAQVLEDLHTPNRSRAKGPGVQYKINPLVLQKQSLRLQITNFSGGACHQTPMLTHAVAPHTKNWPDHASSGAATCIHMMNQV